MQTILVTGSSGTIGTRLCERLMQQGQNVLGVDRVPNKWNKAVQAITTNVDLCNHDASTQMKHALPKNWEYDGIIIHLAANARVYELVEHPDRALENIISLFNTLEYARQTGIKKFVFASSRESYGNIDVESYTEDMVRVENCESPYTASKVGGEALVHAYARCYGIDAVILRFSNVYGMYDDSVRVVPLFIRQAKANKDITVFGEKKCLDFTYIDDTVSGIILTIEKFAAAKNDTFNLAFGQGTTILHLAETVKQLKRSTSTIHMGKPRTGEIIHYVANISKAKKILGFDPQISFDEGIRKAVEWYSQNT